MNDVRHRDRLTSRRAARLTPPTCLESRHMLGPYVDRELHPENALRLERHLVECSECHGWLRTLRRAPRRPVA